MSEYSVTIHNDSSLSIKEKNFVHTWLEIKQSGKRSTFISFQKGDSILLGDMIKGILLAPNGEY